MTTRRNVRNYPRFSSNQRLLIYLTILLLLVAVATLMVSLAMLIVMLLSR